MHCIVHPVKRTSQFLKLQVQAVGGLTCSRRAPSMSASVVCSLKMPLLSTGMCLETAALLLLLLLPVQWL
jgi:hypothetical protein